MITLEIKKINFLLNEKYDPKKIIHIILDKPFPSDSSRWQNQAIQRDYIINNLDFADAEDYIFSQIQMKLLDLSY